MHVVMFYHSLLSDWNHGNAHFLRGVASELMRRGHRVSVYEPRDGWSLQNLVQNHGLGPVEAFHRAYPGLTGRFHDPRHVDADALLHDADLVLVHEWNAPELVRRIGEHRRNHGGYRLLFHDTHHRAVSERKAMARYRLEHYDGVLAFGEVIRQIYLEAGWSRQAWTWHEAADPQVFHPLPGIVPERDLAWIGNWGDDERTHELHQFLLEPARELGLNGSVHGVRYPDAARAAVKAAGLDYRGWIANFDAPRVFAHHRVTVHVPRRPYVRMLPGIPTIRPFEALACGIPLVSAPWRDDDRLFEAGRDYLVATDGAAMRRQLRAVLNDRDMATELARHGCETILARHTCAHRVDQLLNIVAGLRAAPAREATA